MRKRSIWLAALLALVASLVVGPGATAGTEKTQAGTVVFIHDQEPPTLRNNWTDNNLYATALITNRIFDGCEKRNEKGNLIPQLCEAKPKIVKKNPLTVTFKYKANANWSDGKPVTGADFVATHAAFVNPAFNVISRTGWEDMKSVKANGKSVTIVFKKPIADWESYAANGLWPAHIIKGQDMNKMFNDSIPVSNGPWKFQSWQKGVQITLVKNTAFKAGPAMKLDRVVFRYILDTNARFQALKSGEGQFMEPQPQLQIADFAKDPKFKVQRQISQAFEHIDIQFGPKGHAALKQRYVREALVSGMNRSQVADALYRQISPGLTSLQSLIFKPFESAYTKHWAKHPFNQQAVINKLKQHGLHGRSEQADGREQRHLLVPQRRQAVVPVLHDDGQPAPRPDVRDHPAPAEERRHRARAAVPDWWRDVRDDASVERLGSDDVHVSPDAGLEDHLEGPLRVWWRPELRSLLQPQADGAPEQGAEHARAGPRVRRS